MTCATLCGDFWSDHRRDNDALTFIMQVDFVFIILFQYSWTGTGTSLFSSGHPTNIIAFKLWSSSPFSVASVVVLNFHLNIWRSLTGLKLQPLRQTLHLLLICWQDKLLTGDLLTCEPGLYITSKLNCCRVVTFPERLAWISWKLIELACDLVLQCSCLAVKGIS